MQFVRLARMAFVFCCLAVTMVGCGGGGGSSSSGPATQEQSGSGSGGGNQGTGDGASDDGGSGSDGGAGSGEGDGGAVTRSYLAPNNYATVSDCLPFKGSEVSELKIFFLNIGSVPHFDAIVDDAVADFENISPWNEFSQNVAFYRLDLSDPAALGCDGSGRYSCDDEKVHQAIQAQCSVDDVRGILKIALAEADHFGALGEVTYVTTRPEWVEQSEVVDRLGQMVIHQVGHDFGLADYMHANYRSNGLAIQGWDSAVSRQWLNLDGPGCPKWCDSFKPVAEYTMSASAECKNFTDRNSCASFNRRADGQCDDVDGDGHPDCCAWTEGGTDDYFESSCTPVSGTEDIGLACANNAGCYYGGAHGNNSWRPVKSAPESIMFSEHAEAFDTVSQEAIREVMRCCASGESTTGACEEYREQFADFLADVMEFKDRLGSCGVVAAQ